MRAASTDTPDRTVAETGCVHLVMTASAGAIRDCMGCCSPEDVVVLMNSAVLWLAGPEASGPEPPDHRLYCLEPDALAHGVEGLVAGRGVQLISEKELVRQICRHRHCLSWK